LQGLLVQRERLSCWFNPVSLCVEDEWCEFAFLYLYVGAKRNGNFLVVPFHHIDGEFNNLVTREMQKEICFLLRGDAAWLGHECIGIAQSRFMTF